jgi:hypothetical protein
MRHGKHAGYANQIRLELCYVIVKFASPHPVKNELATSFRVHATFQNFMVQIGYAHLDS